MTTTLINQYNKKKSQKHVNTLYNEDEAREFQQIRAHLSLQEIYDEMKQNASLFSGLFDKAYPWVESK